jgi:hypothetical protein
MLGGSLFSLQPLYPPNDPTQSYTVELLEVRNSDVTKMLRNLVQLICLDKLRTLLWLCHSVYNVRTILQLPNLMQGMVLRKPTARYMSVKKYQNNEI